MVVPWRPPYSRNTAETAVKASRSHNAVRVLKGDGVDGAGVGMRMVAKLFCGFLKHRADISHFAWRHGILRAARAFKRVPPRDLLTLQISCLTGNPNEFFHPGIVGFDLRPCDAPILNRVILRSFFVPYLSNGFRIQLRRYLAEAAGRRHPNVRRCRQYRCRKEIHKLANRRALVVRGRGGLSPFPANSPVALAYANK